MKNLAIVGVSALAGNAIAEMAVLKPTADSRGLVLMQPGFGVDDVARAATIAVTTYFAMKLLGGGK
jgi:hypothetical protein